MATAIKRQTPKVNADLTRIEKRQSPGVDEGGQPLPGVFVEIWSGSAPAFVTEKAAYKLTGLLQFETTVTEISFPADLTPIDIDDVRDHRFTFTHAGIQSVVQVDGVEDFADFGYLRAFTQKDSPNTPDT